MGFGGRYERRNGFGRGRGVVLAAIGAAIGIALLPALAMGQAVQYRATLIGANEVPPVTTNATGSFTATLNEGARSLGWSFSTSSIVGVTAAHIQTGAAGVNGVIVLNLVNLTTPASNLSSSGLDWLPNS